MVYISSPTRDRPYRLAPHTPLSCACTLRTAACGRMSGWGHSRVGSNSRSLALNFIRATTRACPLHPEPGAHTSPRYVDAPHMVLDAVLTRAGSFALPVSLATRSAPLLDLDEAGLTGDIHAVFAMQEATWARLATSTPFVVSSAAEACQLAAGLWGRAADDAGRSLRLRGGGSVLGGVCLEAGCGDCSGVVLDAFATMLATGPAGPALFTPTPQDQRWVVAYMWNIATYVSLRCLQATHALRHKCARPFLMHPLQGRPLSQRDLSRRHCVQALRTRLFAIRESAGVV